MKKQSFYIQILVFAIVLLFSGCGIFSLHPLYTREDLLEKKEIIGTWQNNDDEDITLTIASLEGKKYEFILADNGDTLKFEMGLLQLDDQYFIDLYPHTDCSFFGGDDCYALENLLRNYIPAHTFMKFDIHEDDISLTEFDNERLIKLFEQKRIRLPHEIPGEDNDYVVITASTKDLQKFIVRYAHDEKAFKESEKYHRI